MTRYVALLRAVNVGGTGKLAMSDLRAIAADAGFKNPRTYIASGNLVLESDGQAAEVKASLEAVLLAHAGKPLRVIVRTGAEMAAVVAANPFADAPPARVTAIFLDAPPPAHWRSRVTGLADEAIGEGAREIYVHYPAGMAHTKLRVPAARDGTARNMNTVRTLAEWSA